MEFNFCDNYEEMSRKASDFLIKELKHNPNILICTATGNSPAGTYQNLVIAYQEKKELFSALRIIKLDEWAGIPFENEHTCEAYIQHKIIRPLDIDADRYISFESNPQSFSDECERMKKELAKNGPIDICILGLGKNGHIGLNEPSLKLQPFCHLITLSKASLHHEMLKNLGKKPEVGLTLGIADILRSKKIILLVTGKNKERVTKRLFEQKISTEVPASMLWLHPNVQCFIDSNL